MNHHFTFHLKRENNSPTPHKRFINRSISHYNLRSLNVLATDNPRSRFLINSTVYRATTTRNNFLRMKSSKLGTAIDTKIKFIKGISSI